MSRIFIRFPLPGDKEKAKGKDKKGKIAAGGRWSDVLVLPFVF